MGAVAIYAQTVSVTGSGTGSGSITIQNAARGETYYIYKLFEATLGNSGSVAYTGSIPSALSGSFKQLSGTNYVTYKDSGTTSLSADDISKLTSWAASQSPLLSGTSDGSALKFDKLPYGYYVITTTHGASGTGDARGVISVDTTQPNTVVYDKNSTEISVKKDVEEESYNIGDEITYTATFNTTNYIGSGSSAKQVTYYEKKDTLPDFLSGTSIQSIVIKSNENDNGISLSGSWAFDTQKKIRIPWAEKDNSGSYTSKYANGSIIVVTYKATLTDIVKFGGNSGTSGTGNKNTVSIEPFGSGTPGSGTSLKPSGTEWKDDAIVYTYGTALVKVDGADSGTTLSGAVFKAQGIDAHRVADGVYVDDKYTSGSTSGSELEVSPSGTLYILGLKNNMTLKVEEVKAPDGYNKLAGTIDLNTQVTSETYTESSGTVYVDENGNRTTTSGTRTITTKYDASGSLNPLLNSVENNKGSLLPSTGGIGTTIFYVAGAVLVVGAGILLVTRRRMKTEEQ